MKNKWMIILFIFFLGVIFLSLLITQQSQKVVSVPEKENPIVGQVENIIPSAYFPQVRPASTSRPPLVKSGITIIKAPEIEPVEKIPQVSEIADKGVNNVSSLSVVSSTEAEEILQAGITKTGKQPSPQEVQEMNSSGIVMY